MTDRLPLPECITGPRLIVCLDEPPRDDTTGEGGPAAEGSGDRLATLVPVLEVMVQEGMRTFSLSLRDLPVLDEVRDIFVERAEFGVHDVVDVADLDRVLAHRPAFVLASTDDQDVVSAGLAAGVATLPAGLTPNELHRAWRLGAPAVQVVPADLLASSYPGQLHRLVPELVFIPRGGMGGWSMGRWYEEGAIACVADTSLLSDALTGGSLSHLRDRCRTFLDVVPKA